MRETLPGTGVGTSTPELLQVASRNSVTQRYMISVILCLRLESFCHTHTHTHMHRPCFAPDTPPTRPRHASAAFPYWHLPASRSEPHSVGTPLIMSAPPLRFHLLNGVSAQLKADPLRYVHLQREQRSDIYVYEGCEEGNRGATNEGGVSAARRRVQRAATRSRF